MFTRGLYLSRWRKKRLGLLMRLRRTPRFYAMAKRGVMSYSLRVAAFVIGHTESVTND
jgi:hypothetical protein